ncbi:head decoration protein [Celeribacter marinus]|uniref:Putative BACTERIOPHAGE-RELATED PROTEIN n=1 Tax=Celeribacter marinus TaxID=1397108 RepID=A0A0N9ZQM0_9RHOB|nr:head decoration protein [Celeribacter marinus]ALI55976.1 putative BACTERIOPHAGE-RELATED PROTEIN [Celeribacter marinus]SFK96589.1 Bacteriophage lambda head decoration protein D [Celeribacter marinus]
MTTLTEGKHAGGFLIWEVLRDYTRETVTIASGAGKIAPGTVMSKITTGGKYTGLAPTASNGSQTAAGILWADVDASDADALGVVILRGPAIVNRHEIVWPDGATEAQITSATMALAGLGIILR